ATKGNDLQLSDTPNVGFYPLSSLLHSAGSGNSGICVQPMNPRNRGSSGRAFDGSKRGRSTAQMIKQHCHPRAHPPIE
ncbi:MAG TPA: hypothetical protein VHY78_10035, partial [Stellaceae bacterium]|nr:hypothetical protein [Stellaceae bacterium]